MKRLLMIVFCIMLAAFPAVAVADGEVVVITVVDTPSPSSLPAPPTPTPKAYNYGEYEWSQGDIDTLAQGYWQWCNTTKEKADFTMVVVNRVMDSSDMFRNTVENVMTQSGEFNISTARCSDRNRELARENLNRCMTEWMVGDAGVRVPKTAIYVDRVSGVLTMYDAKWNVVWRCA